MQVRHFARFSELVKAIRRSNQLSQRQLAKVLAVSSGYVGQWELGLSQPSPEVIIKLCQAFDILDVAYVQRLAFASRAPQWLRDSILRDDSQDPNPRCIAPVERRILDAAAQLNEDQQERLAERIEGWVEATLESRG